MRILVFGVSGFVGKHVYDRLQNAHEVYGVARRVEVGDTRTLIADLTDTNQVVSVLKKTKPQVVMNCAGLFTNDQDVSQNKVFTKNILDAASQARSVKRMIFCSSASVYGVINDPSVPVIESAQLNATSDYGISKIEEEETAKDLGSKYGIETVAARIFNPIGVGANPRLLVPSLLRQVEEISSGQRTKIEVSRLDAKRDFVDIQDVARAFEILATSHLKYHIFNIGSGKTTTIAELLDTILEEKFPNKNVGVAQMADQPELVVACKADISRLHELGWSPEISLDQSIKEMMNA